MAIYQIPTLEKAVEIMEAAYLTPWEYHPIIFDLAECLDPNDVRTRISQCQCCDLTIPQDLGAYLDECPRCHEDIMRELVDVVLVIQGSVVVYTTWRES